MSKTIELNWQGQVYSEVVEGNLELSQVTPAECRNAIGRSVGKYAFYGAMMADAYKLQSKLQMEYDKWFYGVYMTVAENNPKWTETQKKAQVVLDFPKEYEEWQIKLRNVQAVISKADILRSAFKLQVNALQAVLYSLKAEIDLLGKGDIHAQGSRDLRDNY